MSQGTNIPSLYEAHAATVGYAVTYVAFAAAFFGMIVVERVFSSTLVLLARMVWGVDSVPEGCLEEPMNALAARLKGAMTTTSADSLYASYLSSLSPPADASPDGIQGYASMQMVGAGASFVSSIGGSVAGSLVDGFTALSSYALWVVITTLVFSLLFIIQVLA